LCLAHRRRREYAKRENDFLACKEKRRKSGEKEKFHFLARK